MRRLVTATLAVVLGAVLFTGCAAKPDVSADAAQTLQSSVQEVAKLAAAGDPGAALAELDTLQKSLDSAVADDEVSKDRSTKIQSSIDLVRADLTSAVAAAEAAAAKAAADAQAAAAAQAAADAAAAQAAADAQNAKKGKGDEPKPGKGKDRD